MRPAGFTLIELLVVISITGILSTLTFVNFKSFAKEQQLNKSIGEIQTFLKLAQSNATSSTVCGSSGGVSWTVRFNSDKITVDIICGLDLTKAPYKTLTLQNGRLCRLRSDST